MSVEALCSSCGKQKNNLNVRRSQLYRSFQLLMCESCIKAKFEPRYLIILYGVEHDGSIDAIKEYIKPKRYFGKDILAEDLLP